MFHSAWLIPCRGEGTLKKYVVRLTHEERKICEATVDRLKGSSQKARRARVLLQLDADGPGWTDRQVANAFRCRVKTVENTRRRCVLEGFELALCGKQEARVIAPRLGTPPEGYGNWPTSSTLNRLELGLVDSISHERVRKTLEKTASRGASCGTG